MTIPKGEESLCQLPIEQFSGAGFEPATTAIKSCPLYHLS